MSDFQLSDLTPEQRVAFIQTPYSASLGLHLGANAGGGGLLTPTALEALAIPPLFNPALAPPLMGMHTGGSGAHMATGPNNHSMTTRSRSGSSDKQSDHSSLSSGAGRAAMAADSQASNSPASQRLPPVSIFAANPTLDTANATPARRNASTAPVSLLLHAESLDEVAIMTEYYCFSVPKKLRKNTTRLYKQVDQLAIFVAVGDIIVARAVMASDALPRSVAARNLPSIEPFLPDHWTCTFRVTNVVSFTERAVSLAFPCPVNDRSELPSSVDSGMHIARVWQMTLSSFLEATLSIATGKCEHYDPLLKEIAASDPTQGVPPEVRAHVSAVKMISHGPGIVMLGFIARHFGRLGREYIANSLFELNSGVIDLCRQTMGGALISYLVRNGTCATPKILQLVPWRVVASRVLSDAVGSQTASLMLHSAIQFHRTTRRALEPVGLSSLTHRVLTRNLADATDPSADCTISSIAANAQSCRVLQLVIEACVELGGMHAAGVVDAPPDVIASAHKVIYALADLADKHAADAWGNYATQSLITACSVRAAENEEPKQTAAKGKFFDSILTRVMDVVRPQLVRLSCHKCGSNVIEKLCSSRPTISEQVALALLMQPGTFAKLACDRYGNYVVQTLLHHLPRTLEVGVRDALVPALAALDPHWQCSVAITTWCKAVQDRQAKQLQNTASAIGSTVGGASSVLPTGVPSVKVADYNAAEWRMHESLGGPLAPPPS